MSFQADTVVSYNHVKSWIHNQRRIRWLVVRILENTANPYDDIQLEMTDPRGNKNVIVREYAAQIIWDRFTAGMSPEDCCKPLSS